MIYPETMIHEDPRLNIDYEEVCCTFFDLIIEKIRKMIY